MPGGKKPRHKTLQLCSAWAHSACQMLPPVPCCPLPRFVLSGHEHQPQPGCPGRAWTTVPALASPVPSNGQSSEAICWLPGRKMLGFLPPTPPASSIDHFWLQRKPLAQAQGHTHTHSSLRPLLQERSIPGPPPHHLMLQLPLQRDASPRQVPDGNTDVGEERRGIAASTYSSAQSLLAVTPCPEAAAGTSPPRVVNQG